ncbi:MAG: hypothetical protein EOQ49_32155, partial [Mesorhizobium sp.]
YGAVEGALASGFATAELHHSAGHDLAPRKGSSGGAITTLCPTDSKALKRSLAKSSTLSRQALDAVTSTSSFLNGLR